MTQVVGSFDYTEDVPPLHKTLPVDNLTAILLSHQANASGLGNEKTVTIFSVPLLGDNNVFTLDKLDSTLTYIGNITACSIVVLFFTYNYS